MGHTLSTGEMLQGRSGLFGASGALDFPAGVPAADVWFNAADLVGVVSDGADVGDTGEEWVDRTAGIIASQATAAERPVFDEAMASLGSGTTPTVHFDAVGTDVSKPNLDTDSNILWPSSGSGLDPCSFMWIGRVATPGSIFGDNQISINPSHKCMYTYGGAGDAGACWIGGASASLNMGDVTDVRPPTDAVIIVSKTSQTSYDCFVNGVQSADDIGTFGVALAFNFLGRNRESSGGWPHAVNDCAHLMFWQSEALTEAHCATLSTFYMDQIGISAP